MDVRVGQVGRSCEMPRPSRIREERTQLGRTALLLEPSPVRRIHPPPLLVTRDIGDNLPRFPEGHRQPRPFRWFRFRNACDGHPGAAAMKCLGGGAGVPKGSAQIHVRVIATRTRTPVGDAGTVGPLNVARKVRITAMTGARWVNPSVTPKLKVLGSAGDNPCVHERLHEIAARQQVTGVDDLLAGQLSSGPLSRPSVAMSCD